MKGLEEKHLVIQLNPTALKKPEDYFRISPSINR